MFDDKHLKEWSSKDKLPRGFEDYMKETIREYEVKEKKEFRQIGVELGVNPSILSRWIVGKGPLNQHDIQNLASKLGFVVYTFLGLSRPIIDESITEEYTL
jgi:hypothetical protein